MPGQTNPTRVRVTFTASLSVDSHPTGPHHQRIAKLDRENEVAPPPKVSPTVGRVRIHFSLPHDADGINGGTGHPRRPRRFETLAERRSSEDQRKAVDSPRLRVRQGGAECSDPRQARACVGCQAPWCVSLPLMSRSLVHPAFSTSRRRYWEEAGGGEKVVIILSVVASSFDMDLCIDSTLSSLHPVSATAHP